MNDRTKKKKKKKEVRKRKQSRNMTRIEYGRRKREMIRHDNRRS